MSDRRPLRELVEALKPLAVSAHGDALAAHPLFSSEHWKHNAGYEWPHEPDDGSYELFENCQHPTCKAFRELDAALAKGDAQHPHYAEMLKDGVCVLCGQRVQAASTRAALPPATEVTH